MQKIIHFAMLAALAVNAIAEAAECRLATSSITAQSGATTMALAELYTAEGCDSCPSADKWFSSISHRKGNAVPLAFHVDYWDGGGWKDRFAKPAYTKRQSEAVIRQGSRTVVTPQLIVNGKTINVSVNDDKRGSSVHSRFNKRVSDLSAQPPKATIKLNATPGEIAVDAGLAVTIADGVDRNTLAAWLAITEGNLVSRITAGENSGVTLYHDHVVRELLGPLDVNVAGSKTIAIPNDWKRADLTLVAFVQDQRSGEVLQAVATSLCGN